MSATLMLADPALTGLAAALDADAMAPRLSALTGAAACLVEAVEVVKHKPGRRCSIAYTSSLDGRRARHFAKVFSSDRGATILVSQSRIAASIPRERLIVPRPLAYYPDLRLLLTEFVDGVPLATALYAEESDAPSRRMAEAIAALHDCGVVGARRWSAAKELEGTTQWITGLSGRSPVASGRARTLLGGLHAWARELGVSPERPVHRDFYMDQVWDRDGETALLDLDDARFGDPAVDVGNFLAHLVLRTAQFSETARGCARARESFPAAYLAAREEAGRDGGFLDRVRFYEASSLLRLSGVYAARDRWGDVLPPVLLDACESIVSSREA